MLLKGSRRDEYHKKYGCISLIIGRMNITMAWMRNNVDLDDRT